MAMGAFADTDLHLTDTTTVLVGSAGGKYPSGNTLYVRGTEESLLIDTSVTVVARGGVPGPVDRILVSHAHEDHIAGHGLFPDAKVHAHHEDLLGVHSLEGLFSVYVGDPADIDPGLAHTIVTDFTYTARPDATGFADGQTFDIGGGRVEVIHLPGHTRGHSGFLVEPDGVFFVADVDLSSFGPYYGDHWSDLEDFERAIDRCREVDAKWFVTFHHKGVVTGRDEFLAQLDTFAAVIGRREARLLELLREPHDLEELVEEGIVYRRETRPSFAIGVERRSIAMHLTRLQRDGGVTEIEPGRWRAA
jgi:glyoxylase-like metal-dependent hydrolase (beta-lactamase superfamily II)